MIYTELPKARQAKNKISQKQYISVISPERILNEKLLLNLLLAGIGLVLFSWVIKKSK